MFRDIWADWKTGGGCKAGKGNGDQSLINQPTRIGEMRCVDVDEESGVEDGSEAGNKDGRCG